MHHVDVLGPDPDGSKGRGPLRSRLPDPLSVNSGGPPLSLTIFKLVVGAVIRQWVTVVGVPQEGSGKEFLGTSIQALSALFYSDDRLVALPESARLQGAFDALTGLFDRMGLRTNEGNMASMECCPCQTPHAWSTEAYTWKVMERGLSYKERLRQRVHYPECRVNLADRSLTDHLQRKNSVGRGEATPPPPWGGGGENRGRDGTPSQYRVSFPTILDRLW